MAAYPRYLPLYQNGVLQKRCEEALSQLQSCSLCPRRCGVNRLADETGWCRTGRHAVVASVCRHDGEEPPVSGTQGSGTIFFAHCNLGCSFCQNYEISHYGKGDVYDAEALSGAMLSLQASGCHNLNLVTPSHVGPQILEALVLAVGKGFRLPLLWNSGGYDGPETLQMVDGLIDLYMPDMKYGDDLSAEAMSRVPEYTVHAQRALREMFRQVGGLVLDDNGIALSGMIVRHLVLPGGLSGTDACLDFLSAEVSTDIGLSLMSQYRPAFKAAGLTAGPHSALSRTVRPEEYYPSASRAKQLGFAYTWIQELASSSGWYPDFERQDPFRRWR